MSCDVLTTGPLPKEHYILFSVEKVGKKEEIKQRPVGMFRCALSLEENASEYNRDSKEGNTQRR